MALGIWSAAICLYFLPVLTGRQVLFYFDITEINYPYRAFYASAVKDGGFPLWCPHLYCGFPLFAESQAGALYPPKLLLYPWMPAWLAFSYDTVFHILLAGVAMYVYLRRRVGAAAALAGCAVFGYGGFLPAHVIHTSYLNSLPWIPLALLALERSWETGRPIFALGAVAALSMQILAGNMQVAILTFVGLSVLAGYWTIVALVEGRRSAALNVAGTTVGAMLLATALGAVQIVPALELLGESPRRGGLPYKELTIGSWHPELLPASLFPHAFGTRGYDTDWLDGLYPYHEMYLYLGIVTLLLACCGAARWRNRWVFGHLVLTGVCLLLMLGRYGVLYDVFAWFPVLRGMRMPVRASLWLGLTLGVLAACGVEGLRDRSLRLRGPLLAFGGLIVVSLGLLAAMYRPYWIGEPGATRVTAKPENPKRERQLFEQVTRDFASAGVLVGLSLGAIAGLCFLGRGASRNSRIASILVGVLPLLVLADLLWSQRDLNPTIGHEYWSRPPKLVELVRGEDERVRIHSYDQGVPGNPKVGRAHNDPGYMLDRAAFETAAETVPMSVAAAWGIDNLRGHTPLRPSRIGRYLDLNQAWTLDVANVKYVASATELPPPLGAFEKVMSRPAHVYRNPHVLPRVRLVEEVTFVADADAAFDLLSKREFPARQRLVVEDAERAGQALEAKPDAAPGTARIVVYEPEHVVVDVDAVRPCFLFLADSFYPEWEARVDGQPAAIHPAQLAFRAVALPAGSHRVEFRYRRRAFHTGLAVSLVALVVFAGLGVMLRRRSLLKGNPKRKRRRPVSSSSSGDVRLADASGFDSSVLQRAGTRTEGLSLSAGLPAAGRLAAGFLLVWIAVVVGSIAIKANTWSYLPSPGSEPVYLMHTYQWEVE